jgi:cyclopropane-fatty-acyl-phospholipid synthase
MKKTVWCIALVLACIGVVFLTSKSDSKQLVQDLFAKADVVVGGARPWDIQVHNEAFYDRLLSEGSLGLGESYMDGWWDAKHVDEFIYHIFKAHLDDQVPYTWKNCKTALVARFCNMQDKMKSKEVIEQHYQLGNDLYSKMLDSEMVYSCAYWKDAQNLDEAQKAKFDLICRKLKLQPGMTILDIGCGWGGFVKYAAENYGVKAVGVTLSKNQAKVAKKKCKKLPVNIFVQDYRDVEGSFDRVISIGMFEHVGKKNFREFMEVSDRLLKPDGLMLLHTIGSNTSTIVTDPWIDAYIFPHGQLPSIAQIGEAIEGLFVMEDWHNFGAYYDTTLMKWHENFQKSWPELEPKYGERFYRMWNYYLLSCAGAFRARSIQLWQVVLSKDGVASGYTSLR